MKRRESDGYGTTARLARGVCLVLILAALLPGCRTAHPTQEAALAASPALTVETYGFGQGLAGLVWVWETPDGEVPDSLPEDSEVEFGQRFARFCADTGIAQEGEMRFEVRHAGWGARMQITAAEAVHKRLRDLDYALGNDQWCSPVNVDLLLIEVPEKLARKWGLDGLPAAETPPDPFAQGVPAVLEPGAFRAVRELLLKQRGARVCGAASVAAMSGTTGCARQVDEITFLEAVELGTGTSTSATTAQPDAAKPGVSAAPPSPPVISRSVGQPRDVGRVFEVLPTVASDHEAIDLEVKVDVSSLDAWATYNREEDVRPPPVLSVLTIDTKLACYLGETLIAGRRVHRVERRQPHPLDRRRRPRHAGVAHGAREARRLTA